MNKILVSLVGVVAVLGAGVFLTTAGPSDAASITFIGRGVVKPGGDANSINVYWTNVPASVERIRGVRADVNTSSATKYVWNVKADGTLVKTKVANLPVPEREVVIKGVLHDDDRVTASWVVTNYRQFKVTGILQGIEIDTGSTDSGWITVNGTTSIFRNVLPSRNFKTSKTIGKDFRVRINGLTKVTALGNPKLLDEVTAAQQKVVIEGEVLNEDSWVSSKFNELN